jgi:hypothetical protein
MSVRIKVDVMRKLLVKCSCGQEMQVPRSAFGKSGMCSSCGRTVRIGSDNTRPFSPTPTSRPAYTNAGGRTFNWRRIVGPSEEAKQQFGKAVDLYSSHRYAEALTIFDSLAREFPDNPEIDQARRQCLRAMNRSTLPAPDHYPATTGDFDESTVRQVLLTKMLNGATDSIQLQAAELAARVLGMVPDRLPKRGPKRHPGSSDEAQGRNNGSETLGGGADFEHSAEPEMDERD